MRLIYLIFALALVAAVVVPFYLKTPDGLPLITFDKFLDDNVPAALTTPTDVYRWQDANGVWQFGDSPPHLEAADLLELRPNITPIKADWVAQFEARTANKHGGQAASPTVQPTKAMPEIGDVYSGQAITEAENAAEAMEGRMQQLEGLMDYIRK